MAKLHFRYGAMGSSKTAQALMTRFNYLERGRNVLLLKPDLDTRDGETTIKSRVGLAAEAVVLYPESDIFEIVSCYKPDVVILDEAQFVSEGHISQLRDIVSRYSIPVLCFGLRTDFQGKLFPGSKALFELADEIQEVRSICDCGANALINARFDSCGQIITEGDVVDVGGNEKYKALCWKCYQDAIKNKQPF